ncbi:hypothetical protein [Citreimonas salinaria]|uniref:Uncharacterized protein n=1 Tax=Citreimonas salinaria TaxID=321339 RepID=A0A1H3JNW4_9RHOB|nr:hypothetical protein [Citreimonas salinaria]SDY41289.1 hypothetical protein SAMN05444340_107140 [Citreimonas salinaria]
MESLIVIMTIITFNQGGNLLSVETQRFDDPATCSSVAASINQRMRVRKVNPATYDISCATF